MQLNVANRYRGAKTGQWIVYRHKLVRDIAIEAGVGDGLHYALPLNFLSVIEFMATRHAAGVKMAIEARVGDGLHYALPLNFLSVIEFMATRHAAGVKMAYRSEEHTSELQSLRH